MGDAIGLRFLEQSDADLDLDRDEFVFAYTFCSLTVVTQRYFSRPGVLKPDRRVGKLVKTKPRERSDVE